MLSAANVWQIALYADSILLELCEFLDLDLSLKKKHQCQVGEMPSFKGMLSVAHFHKPAVIVFKS